MNQTINGPVVEIAPGEYARKSWAELHPQDKIVFGGGPLEEARQNQLLREIEERMTLKSEAQA